MATKEYATIIIGGGIAGLSCARRLTDHHQDFLLITENIGGRICTSQEGNVPYGAYFVGNDYAHVLAYVEKRKKINLFDIAFHKGRKRYALSTIFLYPLQLMRLKLILKKFMNHYSECKKRCEVMSQKEAIMSDPYLYHLYMQRADHFIQDNGIMEVVDRFVAEVLYGLLFLHPSELYAFEFLRWAQYYLIPTYEFIFLRDKLTRGFKEKICIDSVVSLKKLKYAYLIKTKKKKAYLSRNVVVATPPHISQQLLGLKGIKNPADAHMFHIRSSLRTSWKQTEYNVFHDRSKILDIAHQSDGTYLFYCKQAYPELSHYFTEYTILAHKHWNPAFNLNGNVLWDCKYDDGLYLIGDHNICGLEDSFITGLYAANKIIVTLTSPQKTARLHSA